MEIDSVIDEKRKKLKEELEKEEPNLLIVKRLQESVRRHKEEIIRIKRMQRKVKSKGVKIPKYEKWPEY